MRYFSYRNKLRLRSLTVTIVAVILAVLALTVGIFLYLQRFIVYTPSGAYLDMGKTTTPDTPPATPNFVVEQPTPPDAGLVVEAPAETETPVATQRKLSGVYIDAAMLTNMDALSGVPAATGQTIDVMLDVKSVYGNYFYSSEIPGAEISSSISSSRVDQLIAALEGRPDVYLIARLPALRDSAFALSNQSCGLPLSNGALWMDAENCYWLDPANDLVISQLEAIALDLQRVGFDEVAFSDFNFPASANIAYSGDRSAAVVEAARRLSANLADTGLKISFFSTNVNVAPHAIHLFAQSSDGADVQPMADGLISKLEDVASGLVFLTDSHDTRFSSYGILTPAIATE